MPTIVADKTETSAPPIIVGMPMREIISRLLGASTLSPPKRMPMEEMLANPHKM